MELISYSNEQMRRIRGNKISMIFQEPSTSLNPVFTIGSQVIESLILHRNLNKKAALEKAIEIIKQEANNEKLDKVVVGHLIEVVSGDLRVDATQCVTAI